ncbi:sugar ABC transporter ATP-binding protein [Mesorhizobium sp. CU2]|uniref:sugar ABC transporter ATP-binding protein n=1 Tax=unclassified Mesorhizobium TaxID=325217 RepID=UPI001129859E|nr:MULTISPECIES: sugar ABC transporter ATP-binding protein [unclassified Mesorhizobium]TPN88429.1 sugar ABC transporter ATP-binding protein [Mesorhizobium sp. CU3]TPO15596.1 sugar ABC transporter ATP-binding protein [Mesorhizobium sp. CU2]
MTTVAPLLAARGVSKAFFGNPVLRGVSIALQPGRVHALLGENGAGKSTLINLLSGALRPDGGEIEVDGRAVPRMTPVLARQAGIAVVQQELSLTASLSIAENIGLGAYPKRFGLIDYNELAARAKAACELVGLNEPLSTPVGHLALGRRQMVEIANALYRKPRVLILDEPTSSLSATETKILMDLLERLRGEGIAILYISHRLNEVMALCQHVTVLKDGTCTADRPLAGTDAAGLVRLMVGRDPGDLFPKWQPAVSTTTAITVRKFSAGLMRDVDLDIRTGEVLGIGGLVGQGQEDLLLGLYGAIPARTASATVNGVSGLPGGVPKANALGLAYVPADRKREGLHLIHPILTNMMLPAFARLPALKLRSRKAEGETGRSLAAQLAIKGDLQRPAQALSGGNQQKVALAKWMPHDPLVLLLNDPTRGVDVETKREVYLMLRAFAAAGKAVVLLSSDTPELVHLCDRVAVVREGRVAAMLERAALSEETIVSAAMGAGKQKVAA